MALGLLLVITLVGCGKKNKTSGKYTMDEFKTMLKIRANLQSFSWDIFAAATSGKPRADSNRQLEEVVKKYSKTLPRVELSSSKPDMPQFKEFKWTPALKGTDSEKLLKLYKEKGLQPAYEYLVALTYLYGIADFEAFLVEHAIDDGHTINANDPPQQSEPGRYYWSYAVTGGGLGAPNSGITVDIAQDPSTGMFSYEVSCYDAKISLSYVVQSPWEMEFHEAAADKVAQGDEMLLDNISL